MQQLEWTAEIVPIDELRNGEAASYLLVNCRVPEPLVVEGKVHRYYSAQGAFPTNDPLRKLRSWHIFDWGLFGKDMTMQGTVLENCVALILDDLKIIGLA
jgi:hypothetical protein